MKKLLLLALVVLFAAVASSYLSNLSNLSQEPGPGSKTPILRVALVADSHDENDLLGDALRQAQGKGINFIIGLGDYTNLGTVEELSAAKREFDKSKLPYFLTAGDRDGWESRALADGRNNFGEVFGEPTHILELPGCHSERSEESSQRIEILRFTQDDNKNNPNECIQFVLLDNSDIYSGISQEDWEILKSITSGQGTTSTTGPSIEKARDTRDTLDTRGTLTFVFAHKTPFHPESSHVMGENSVVVAGQAKRFMDLMETTYPCHSVLDTESSDWIPHQVRDDECSAVDGFFSGDLHFFARYNSPGGSVKITTIGAVASQRNFQGPRFGVLTVWDDYSWEVSDIEIR